MNAWVGKWGHFPEDKPTVVLLLDKRLGESCAQHVGAGCEEEGVPLCWGFEEGSSGDLSHRAALRSRLQIGIGIDLMGGSVSLQTIPDFPYFSLKGTSDSVLRRIGQVAGRLSKGEPISSASHPQGGGEHFE